MGAHGGGELRQRLGAKKLVDAPAVGQSGACLCASLLQPHIIIPGGHVLHQPRRVMRRKLRGDGAKRILVGLTGEMGIIAFDHTVPQSLSIWCLAERDDQAVPGVAATARSQLVGGLAGVHCTTQHAVEKWFWPKGWNDAQASPGSVTLFPTSSFDLRTPQICAGSLIM